MARQRLVEKTKYTLEIRKLYIHESKHKHAIRKSRESRIKFLTKDELKRKRKNVQNNTIDKSYTLKTRTRSNISYAKKKSVN